MQASSACWIKREREANFFVMCAMEKEMRERLSTVRVFEVENMRIGKEEEG